MILQHGLSEDNGYTVNQSLRFRANGSAYLSRVFGTATNIYKSTFSCWMKKGKLDTQIAIFGGRAFSGNRVFFYLNATNQLALIAFDSNDIVKLHYITSSVLRDPSAHYHLQFTWDNSVSSQIFNLYINGSLQSLATNTNTVAQNTIYALNYTNTHIIGMLQDLAGNPSSYFDGYLSEINFIDGQALGPTSFGQTDPATGIWVPKKYVGTYGTNGFYLPFNDATSLTTLGYDRSGNGNNWTCNNISLTAGATYDVMKDSPTNSGSVGNYATLNPLYPAHSTLTNGNLTASGATDLPTIIPDSGTWYFEIDGVSKTWTPPAAFPAAAGNYNFGQRPFTNTPTYPTLHTGNLPDATPVTTSGTFTGNASTDGPCIFINGTPTAMTINSNAVTFATHADKLAGGFKVRSALAAYNTTGTNTYSITTNSGKFKNARAQANP